MPISAWTADWHDLSHNHEVRWPYVFVSAYEDGLQVFDLKDPKHPEDRRALLHLRVRARARLRRDAGQRLAEHHERGAGRVRRRRAQLRWPDRALRHAHRSLALPAWTASTAGTATTTACRTSRACRTGITGPETPSRPDASGDRRQRCGAGGCARDRCTLRGMARRGRSRRGARSPLGQRRARSTSRCSTRPAAPTATRTRAAGLRAVAVRRRGRRPTDARATTCSSTRPELPDPSDARRILRVRRVGGHDRTSPSGHDSARSPTAPPRSARRTSNKFLLVITAEAEQPLRRSHAGPTVLHGTSPSGWLQSFLSHPLFRGIPP